jgi:hypothetical protein
MRASGISTKLRNICSVRVRACVPCMHASHALDRFLGNKRVVVVPCVFTVKLLFFAGAWIAFKLRVSI